jgi:hypothetical protein
MQKKQTLNPTQVVWLVVSVPLKNMSSSSWDDFPFPIYLESHNPFHGSSQHQPEMRLFPITFSIFGQ